MNLLISEYTKPPRFLRNVFVSQLKWIIRLRWYAVAGIAASGLICTSSMLFPVLESALPIYICAAILFGCNVLYHFTVKKLNPDAGTKELIMGMVQVEIDLVILTALLHFSGGITNPFELFYVFHVIIATIILPRTLAFSVGISAIVMFGLMSVGEMNEWPWLHHHPLILSSSVAVWENPVYVMGAFIAFSATVVLTQHLTRTVIARMTAKELEAARNHDVLAAIIKSMAEGLIFVTNKGKIALCNPEARLWIKADSANKETIRLDDFPEELVRHVTALLAENASEDTKIKFNVTGSEEAYIEGRSCSVESIDGTRLGYVIVGQDLTEHQKLEKELMEQSEETSLINEMLKKSRIEMAQREKMVAIGQMASGIAHEIGNPLASLSSVVQYLKRKITDEKLNSQLDLIGKQVRRISDILKRMLGLARPATSEYKWSDINMLIEGTLSLVKFDRRSQNVEIKSVPNTDLPVVWLNPGNFEQVLLNITVNALDAILAKGDCDGQNYIEVTSQFNDGMIEIKITDTGIGMEPQVCQRAFDSFFTTKEIGKGTGLGLYISYNLVNEIDGTISLDSEIGKGTTVTIRIPKRAKKHLINDDGMTNENQNTHSR